MWQMEVCVYMFEYGTLLHHFAFTTILVTPKTIEKKAGINILNSDKTDFFILKN